MPSVTFAEMLTATSGTSFKGTPKIKATFTAPPVKKPIAVKKPILSALIDVRLKDPPPMDADETDEPVPDLMPRTDVKYTDPQEPEPPAAPKESTPKDAQVTASQKPSAVKKPANPKTTSVTKSTKTPKKSNATAKSVATKKPVASKKPSDSKAPAVPSKGSNMLKQIANTDTWNHGGDILDKDIIVAHDTPPGYEVVRDRRGNPVADWRNGQKKFRPIPQGHLVDSGADTHTYPKYSKPNSNRRYDASTDSFVELTLDGDSTPVPVQTSRPSSTTSEHSANRFQVLQDNDSDDGSITVVPDSDDPKAPPPGPDFR
jgi:outer membrane biosynthesis protein TonB